ncbi:hypothetical protein AK830_g3949 [Neonectria ditissima]|uniref:BZIP domain-containing protein n=1 Tax=Neonectria ditissima TaxID=78410 RepID=A0A0P7BAC1_9HYPO|nr:hypothetical protein AK830_g3949 [Neonectria ditissima]
MTKLDCIEGYLSPGAWIPLQLGQRKPQDHPDNFSALDIFSSSKLSPTVSSFHSSALHWDCLGINSQLVPRRNTPPNLAIQSVGLWPQANQGSPSPAGTDSTGATPTSPRTPSSPTWPPQSFSLHPSSTVKDTNQPSLPGAGEGQCAGPRGQECVGDLAQMSQGGPASRHASRRSSRSPVDDDPVSPSSMRYGKSGSRDMRQDLGSVPRTNGEGRTQQVPPRTLGVHNILNPSEPRRPGPGDSAGHPQASRPSEAEIPTSTPGPFRPTRPFSTAQPASLSLPGTPVGAMTPLGGPFSERNSPTTAFPFPAIPNPRRKLSPRPPRAMSLSHGRVSHQNMDPRPPLPSMPQTKRPYENDGPDEHRSQIRGHHHPGMPSGLGGGIQNPSRTHSQPMIQSPGPHTHHPAMPTNNPPAQHQPPMSPQTPFHPGMQPGRSYSNAPPNEGAPWTEMIRRHGMGGAMVGAEGQQAFMTLPGSDTPIPVQVDYSQASKKADEKRQRNAVASTRHRRKKKIIQEENTKQLQELRDERRALEVKVEELILQRDFYRDDRNRLRDIVSQTPGISALAAGPSSPASARSSSYAERSPLMTVPHPSMSSQYPGDSSAERPAQRRRTDDHPDFSMPVYGVPGGMHPSASPGALPPMQAPSYGAPSRPTSATSSSGGERLPPLRSMEGPPPPGLGPGHVQEQDPRTGQWVSVQPRPQETGWATRRPTEGPTR